MSPVLTLIPKIGGRLDQGQAARYLRRRQAKGTAERAREVRGVRETVCVLRIRPPVRIPGIRVIGRGDHAASLQRYR